MPRAEVEKLGFKCTTGQSFDTCELTANDKRFATIGGAPVKEIGVVIFKDKVNLIRIVTDAAYWELKEAMIKNYGKRKEDSWLSVLWDRGGAEWISAGVLKAKTRDNPIG